MSDPTIDVLDVVRNSGGDPCAILRVNGNVWTCVVPEGSVDDFRAIGVIVRDRPPAGVSLRATFTAPPVEVKPEPESPIFGTWRKNPNGCGCWECNPNAAWFVVCGTCGNKRCPRAQHHERACSGTNEPGQVGGG